MHYLSFFLFIFLFNECITAQVEKPQERSSPKEMREQMAQANREMKQMVTDLEIEIAEAKKRGDAAESIQEMEKQLAAMKKMMGSIEKASTLSLERPKRNPDFVDKIPVYKSPIVPIPLKQPVIIPTEAQAKDSLLWYKGKKITPNILVTTRGMVVWHDKARNMVVLKPDPKKDSLFVNLVAGLSRTEMRKNNFATTISGIKNSFLLYPEVIKAYDEFDFIRERFDRTAKNAIDLPAPGHAGIDFRGNNSKVISGPFADFEISIEAPAES